LALATVRLTEEQSVRIAELPPDYRVVGVDARAPLVRRPAGQLLRIQPNGHLVAATLAEGRMLAEQGEEDEEVRSLPDGPVFATPYTAVFE
jgi:hypothetical protein